MAYWNAAGLAATRAVEGGAGGYTAHDPNSSASGAYSFLTSTWQTYAPKAGVDINKYPYAYMAPPAAQDAVAAITPVSNWGGTWAGSGGANAINPAYIQATPMTATQLSGSNFTAPSSVPDYFTTSTTPGSQSSYPITDNSGQFGTDNQTPGGVDPVTGQPDVILPDVNAGAPAQFQSGTSAGGASPTSATGALAQPGQGTPVQVNLGPQTASDLQSWVNAPINAAEKAVSGWFAQMQNWFGRGFLILIGIVVVGIALWKATGGPSTAEIIEAVK